MVRRSFIAGLAALGGLAKAGDISRPKPFPPVPTWRPSFGEPLDRVTDRISYYHNGASDFAVLRRGTCVVLDAGLNDADARAFALRSLSDIIHFHPDMTPAAMDDGNILVRYSHPAMNVVLHDVAQAHWAEIEARHLDGLTPDEVLITPLGQNRFDDFGKQALLGRAWMFMDALAPDIVAIKRHR